MVHFNCKAYRQRSLVGRLISQFECYRRVTTRYDRRAVHFLSFGLLAVIGLNMIRILD
ncbi:hypothetical protein D7X55_22930 [Corallococcus sp. AB049A]|nr:hypothetical protein D7X55_22930 [Corallococcus sp. AB049A]